MPFLGGEDNLLQLNRERFDFNLRFEHLFFSIIPSALFIVLSTWRTLSQVRKPTIVTASSFRLVKLGAIALYAGLQLSLLISVAVGTFHVNSLWIAAAALQLASALSMILLSVLDHSKSPRPSMLLSGYLLLTLLLDIAQARTLFLLSSEKPELTYSSTFTATIGLKVVILLLEAQQKTRWVQWNKKEHSPEETSGIFSLGVYFWLNRIFLAGYGNVLNLEDLYSLDYSFDAGSLHTVFSAHLDHTKLKNDKWGLVKALVRTLRGPLLAPVLPRLALLGFTICQPIFIHKLIEYLSEPHLDPNIGYGLIGASIFIYAGIAFSTALYWYFHHRMKTMARSILVTEIYMKATTSRIGAKDDSAAVTLMSTDMERIRQGFRTLHDVWAGMVQAAIVGWMLYNRLGVVFVAPIGLVLVCFTGLGILITFTGDSQRLWMAGVQKRVGLTAAVIANTKNLKLSGLSHAIQLTVQKLRVDELAMGARFRKIFIMAASLGFLPLLLGPPLTFAFTRRRLGPSTLFTSLSLLTLLTTPLAQIFQSIPELVSGFACLGRIQAFLETEDHHDFRQFKSEKSRDADEDTLPDLGLAITDGRFGWESSISLVERRPGLNRGSISTQATSDPGITIERGQFGWEEDKFALRAINTHIPSSMLTMVVGPVGSGKSTLCKALLGEMPFHKGDVRFSTRSARVAFCDQKPFLFNGTIRKNIVGYSAFHPDRFEEVIRAAALKFDVANFPQGDQTNIGSDGTALSGGQKQRIALARALYLDADLLVLDDIFSGLDADTEQQVFQQVFGPGGLLRRRSATVVLCTHSVRHLQVADHIIVLGDGMISEQGSFTELMSGHGYVQRLGIQPSYNSVASSITLAEMAPALQSKVDGAATVDISHSNRDAQALRQVGDKTVYKHYFQSMGFFLAGCSLFFGVLWGFFVNFPTIWLTYWTKDRNSAHPKHTHAYYAGIYTALQMSAVISLLLLGISLFVVSVKRAGANLHHEALRTLIRAPLAFFTSTDTGVVTNLFSQDLNLIDTELPDATLNTMFCVFQAIGQAGVMLTSSRWLAISYPFLGLFMFVVSKFYLRTSRQLRLLDLEAKSPLYTHFLDTLKGIATLRAFGFLSNDVHKNAGLINTSQRPAYLLLMVQEWLTLVLDLVVMIMAVVLTTLAVRIHSSAAFAGASLFSLLSFGQTLSGIVTNYTRLETSIGAIARLKMFNEGVKPEDREEEDIVPDEHWPQKGEIELRGVCATYDSSNNEDPSTSPKLALDTINLHIQPGEKIAICGRTGSGKSSLVSLLLKLLDPTPSTHTLATIDSTPLHRISRPALRQRIIAVPQEAVFLPDGTSFQENLDPDHLSTPQECAAVLQTVRLWDFVRERGGLDAGMSSDTLSAGQRQLFSLGRALLRRYVRARAVGIGSPIADRGILVLDEVISSVDFETEELMRDIIRDEFKNYTVVAVSHRLGMVMDFDTVVVMERGKVVEVGVPRELAAREGTRFGELVRAGG